MSGLKVTKVQVYNVDEDTNLIAIVQVTLNNALKLTGLKVFKRTDGIIHVQYPVNPKSKKQLAFSFPIDLELRDEIEDAIVRSL